MWPYGHITTLDEKIHIKICRLSLIPSIAAVTVIVYPLLAQCWVSLIARYTKKVNPCGRINHYTRCSWRGFSSPCISWLWKRPLESRVRTRLVRLRLRGWSTLVRTRCLRRGSLWLSRLRSKSRFVTVTHYCNCQYQLVHHPPLLDTRICP